MEITIDSAIIESDLKSSEVLPNVIAPKTPYTPLLNNSITPPKIDFIVHIADIHIRNNYDREDEYNLVFEQLYTKVKHIPNANKHNTAIVICGDVTHDARYDKGKISANVIAMLNKFFKNLALLGYVIVIPGNHDNNITHQERTLDTTVDILSSVLENHIDFNTSVFYVKDTGLYTLGNCIFYHTSVFDIDKITGSKDYAKRKKFLQAKLPDTGNTLHHIGLLHCSIDGANIASSYILKGQAYKINDIKQLRYDICLLGDVHEHQYLDEAKTIAYPSSLIQQNFGENSTEHGFILWALPEIPQSTAYSSTFHTVDNIYRHTTITLDSDITVEAVLSPLEFAAKSYIKLVIQLPRSKEYINNLKSAIAIKTNIISWRINEIITTDAHTVDLSTDISNTETFSKYIDTLDINTEDRTFIEELHLEKIKALPNETKINNKILWGSIEIHNFRGYVGKHTFSFKDIEKHSSISINGHNANGKSTLLDAFIYCLWGYKQTSSLKSFINASIKETPHIIVEFTDNSATSATKKKRVSRAISANGKKETVKLEQYNVISGNWDNLSGIKKHTEASIIKLVGSQQYGLHTFISKQNDFDQFINNPSTEFLSELLNCNLYLELSNDVKLEHKKQRRALAKLEGSLEVICVDIKTDAEQMDLVSTSKTYMATIAAHKDEIQKLDDSIKQIDILYNDYSAHATGNLQHTLDTYNDDVAKYTRLITEHTTQYATLTLDTEFYAQFKGLQDALQRKLSEIQLEKENLIKNLNDIAVDIDITSEQQELNHCNDTKHTVLNTIVSNISRVSDRESENLKLGVTSADFGDIHANYELYNNHTKALELAVLKLEQTDEIILSIEQDIKYETRKMTFADECCSCDLNCRSLTDCHTRKREQHVDKKTALNDGKDATLKELAKLKTTPHDHLTMLEYQDNISKIDKIVIDNNILNKEIKDVEFKITHYKTRISDYNKNKSKSEENKQTNADILTKNTELANIKADLESNTTKYNTITVHKESNLNFKHHTQQLETIRAAIRDTLKSLALENNYNENMTARGTYQLTNDAKKKCITELNSKISAITNTLDRSAAQMVLKTQYDTKIAILTNKIRLLGIYLNIIDTTGFPNYIINQTLPLLSNNVNRIVSTMGFNFTCDLSITDNKKKVRKDRKLNINYIKDEISFKPSGSEIFAASIAFRIALSKLAQHTSSNLFWIDEGFGSLDKTRQDCLDTVFEYIKSEFDYLVYISHIDYIKNKADVNIEIKNFTITIH